jgi:hypothetical protein
MDVENTRTATRGATVHDNPEPTEQEQDEATERIPDEEPMRDPRQGGSDGAEEPSEEA